MQFYVSKDGDSVGPIAEAELIDLWRRKELHDTDFVWTEELNGWVELGSIIEVDTSSKSAGSRILQRGTGLAFVASRRVGDFYRKEPVLNVGLTLLGVLLLTFFISWSYWLSLTILCIFVAGLFILCLDNFFVALIAPILLIAIGAYYLQARFPEHAPSPSVNSAPVRHETDGVFESATEKMDKGLPLNKREEQRIYDILHYKDKAQAEAIERKHGERP